MSIKTFQQVRTLTGVRYLGDVAEIEEFVGAKNVDAPRYWMNPDGTWKKGEPHAIHVNIKRQWTKVPVGAYVCKNEKNEVSVYDSDWLEETWTEVTS